MVFKKSLSPPRERWLREAHSAKPLRATLLALGVAACPMLLQRRVWGPRSLVCLPRGRLLPLPTPEDTSGAAILGNLAPSGLVAVGCIVCKAVIENILPVKKEGHGCLKTVVAWMTRVVPTRSGAVVLAPQGRLFRGHTQPSLPWTSLDEEYIVSEIRTALKASSRRHFACLWFHFRLRN